MSNGPPAIDRRDLTGPFDLVGDVHGCAAELRTLLKQLGYVAEGETMVHPEGRTVVFVGDLVDRGPDSPGVLALVTEMVEAGNALCVLGNHDARLERFLRGRNVQRTHGLDLTIEQLAAVPAEQVERWAALLARLPHHLLLDGGRLVVAHGGLAEPLHGVDSAKARAFALYGDPTGERDADGLPIRRDWAAAYRGEALVVFGHTPVRAPVERNNTANIDTGCVFGGRLTALRYPERTLVSVPARREYAERRRMD